MRTSSWPPFAASDISFPSPFGPWDYPQNEEPPNNYFGDPMDVDPLDPSSDPIVDTTFAPPPRVAGAFGGLEDEMRLIEKCDGVDLDAVLLLQDADDEKPDDDRILSTKEDDNETDDEDNPPEKFAAPPKAKVRPNLTTICLDRLCGSGRFVS